MDKMTPSPPRTVEDFINSAEKKPLQPEDKQKLPWLNPNVRDDVIKGLNVRLSEPYLIKLKFIGENSRCSQQRFARETLEKAIDEMIDKIIHNATIL